MSDGDGELEARLVEQEEFEPSDEFVEQANVSDPDIYDEFEENWPHCWERAAEMVDWYDDYDTVLDDSEGPFYEWFQGGTLNASYNCVDRHVENGDGDRTAINWEGEHGDTRTYTYEDLQRKVNEFAASLRDLGIDEERSRNG